MGAPGSEGAVNEADKRILLAIGLIGMALLAIIMAWPT